MADPATPTRATRSKRAASSQLAAAPKRKKADDSSRDRAVQLDQELTAQPSTHPISRPADEGDRIETPKTPLSTSKGAQAGKEFVRNGPPTEIIEQIAMQHILNEKELVKLFQVSKHVHTSASSVDSATWRNRFLDRWDPPFVDNAALYRAAYQERHHILTHSIDYGVDDLRLAHQLRTLLAMVLETYKPFKNHLPPGTRSRNIEAFQSRADWMRKLLTSPFFDYRGQVRGRPHMLFDALQLLFSYLLISPRYDISKTVPFARSDYDIAIVYNWNKDFKTLFKRLPQTQNDNGGPSGSSDVAQVALGTVADFRLDLYALLNIRNFWHRHLVFDQIETTSYFDTPDDTFYRTVEKLTELGHIPKAWSSPVQDYEANLNDIVRGKWVGLYSTIRDWPDKEETMSELQTDATDWCDSIDPLVLNFLTTRNTNELTFGRGRTAVIWPDIFRDIPCFQTTVPVTDTEINSLSAARLGPVLFLQGFAPFMDIEAEIDAHQILNGTFDKKARAKSSKHTGKKASASHPFNALRLRGVIHPLPTSVPFPDYLLHSNDNNSPPSPPPLQFVPALPVPGFRRIALVLYKPSDIDLIKQLEFADENYGSAFAVSVTAQMSAATQAAYNAMNNGNNTITDEVLELMRKHLAAMIEEREEKFVKQARAEGKKGFGGEDDAGDGASSMPKLTKEQKAAQERRERNKLWTTERIVALETGYHQSGPLEWNDMDWAYAYEGVVCPGGNVMMGRWWRVGLAGLGLDGVPINDGLEVDQKGEGVPTRVADHAIGRVGENGVVEARKLERGPFVFWGMKAD